MKLKDVKLQPIFKTAIVPLACGLIGAVLGVFFTLNRPISPDERITSFYEDEMATVVSPSAVKKMVDTKDTSYILVDLRSAGEYNNEHFINAVNIPAGSMSEEELVSAFAALPKDKEVIVHCYSAYCTLGRQIGQTLAQNGIYVKELTIGWSELKYHWDLWNPGAKVTDGEKYIIKGTSKTEDSSKLPEPCVQGKYGC